MTFMALPPVPTVQFAGIWTIRAAISAHTDDLEEKIRWRLAPGVPGDETGFGIIGDLLLSNERALGGVTIFGELSWDGQPEFNAEDDAHWEYGDALVALLGSWASDALYDFASAVFNSLVVGTPYELEAQWTTPPFEVVSSDEARTMSNP